MSDCFLQNIRPHRHLYMFSKLQKVKNVDHLHTFKYFNYNWSPNRRKEGMINYTESKRVVVRISDVLLAFCF